MGPRGGGGFGFLHMIGGLVGMVLFLAILLGLAALAYKFARKKGWVSGGHRPGHGPRHEPGAPPPGPGPFLVAIADDGHMLVWSASKALDIESGQRFTIAAATIKAITSG